MRNFPKIVMSSIVLTTLTFGISQIFIFDVRKIEASTECNFSNQVDTDFPFISHSFSIKEYEIPHHGITNKVNINVLYTEKEENLINEVPIYGQIYSYINQFMAAYPNDDDFWEIVNQKLAKEIFSSNPHMSSLMIELEIMPNNKIPNNRRTTIVLSNQNKLIGKWNFLISKYPINHLGKNTIDVEVEYSYYYEGKSNNNQYINFVKIRDRIIKFLDNYPNTTDSWEVVNEKLTRTIFDENTVISLLSISIKILPNPNKLLLMSTNATLQRCF